jgi:phage-related protein
MTTWQSQLNQAGMNILNTIVTGLLGAGAYIRNADEKIIKWFTDGINSLTSSLMSIGNSMVQSVWAGIQAAYDWFYQQVLGWFQSILSSVENALGIGGSGEMGEMFTGMGASAAAGFLQGIASEFNKLQPQFGLALNGLNPSSMGGMGGGNYSSQNDHFQFFAPVVIQGSTPSGSLGASLKGKRY